MSDQPGERQEPAYVEVVGEGRSEAVSDLLHVTLAAESRAESVGAAFDGADRALRRIVTALRERGAGGADLRTSQIELHPDHDRHGQPSGYRASMGVELSLQDLASAGETLAAAVEAGGDASRVYGMSLTAVATDEAVTAARDAAWADARAKATQFAALAGRELGAVLRVTEEPGRGGPVPMAAGLSPRRAEVEPGTQTVHVTVAVRWALT